jgi:hypothetical protein
VQEKESERLVWTMEIKLYDPARNEAVGKWWRLGLDELRSHEAFGPKAVYLL